MSIEVYSDVSAIFGPARQQGQRPTCLAFAMSDLSRFHAQSPVLSAEYLYRAAALRTPGWQPGDGLYMRYALDVTEEPGIPHEVALPYAEYEPTLPITLPLGVTDIPYVSSRFKGFSLPAQEITASLAEGQPVGLVLKITLTFLKPMGGIVEFSKMVLPKQRHAVIATAAGVMKTTSVDYIRIRNSWGTQWGDAGYAWVPADYINMHAVEAFRI